jgi:AsmA protein
MRWFKRIAIGVAVLAVLAAIGVAALVLLVDPNRYKAPIADAVQKHYGRTLRINGDLSLTVFPRLGIEIENMSLSEPGSNQVFAAVDSARVSVALLPLMSRRLVVDHVKIDGLKANIVRDRQGRFNFDDLLASAQNNDLQSAPVPLDQATAGAVKRGDTSLQLDVAGVEFTDGELALRDDVQGMAVRFERLSASTGRVAPRTPFRFDMSARIMGQNPRVDATVQSQGSLWFDPDARQFSARNFELKATGVLPSVRATAFTASGSVAFDALRQSVDASGVAVVFQGDVAGNTPLTGIDAHVDMPKLSIGLTEGRMQIEKLVVSSQGRAGADPFQFNLSAPRLEVSSRQASGDEITGRARLSGPSGLDARFALSGVSGTADKLAISRVALNAVLKQGTRVIRFDGVSPLEASIPQKTMALPKLAVQVQIGDPALPGKNVKIPVTGSVRADFERERVITRLAATINGDKFLATADASQFDNPRVAFTMAADALDLDALLPPSTTPKKDDGAPAGKPAKDIADQVVDLSRLKGLTAQGSIKIGRLVSHGFKAADVAAMLRLSNGRADVSGLKASLYGGNLSGSLFADANTQRLGLASTFTNVLIQPLLDDLTGRDTLSGRGNVALNITASGRTVQALKRSLNGTGEMSLRDGAIKGVNLAQSLRDFKSMLLTRSDTEQQNDGARQTDFSELQTQMVFANGVATVRSLVLKAPLLRVTQGEPARIDVGTSQLDLAALVTVVNTSTGQDGKDLALLHNVTIPFLITGPMDAPHYSIQWSHVGSELIKNPVTQKLEDKLGIGSEAQREKLKENVKDRLKGLFGR